MDLIFGITIGVVLLALLVISCLKGRWWALLFCLVPVAVLFLPLTAVTVAKPRSLWAKWFYGPEKMYLAFERHMPAGYRVVEDAA